MLSDDCVEVTYAPELSESRELIAQALQAWANVDCTRLCLMGPRETAEQPDALRGERRIHFVVKPELPAVAKGTLTTLTYTARAGAILSAEVAVKRDALPGLTLDDYLKPLGEALGLGKARGIDSVMSVQFEPGVNE